MKISPQLFKTIAYFLPRLMFLETNVAPKINWGDIVQVLAKFPKMEYDLCSENFWSIWFEQWENLGNQYLYNYSKTSDKLYSINCIRHVCASYHWAEFMYFRDVNKKIRIRKSIRKYFLIYLDAIKINYEYEVLNYNGTEIPYFIFYPKNCIKNTQTIILCNGLDSVNEVEIFSIAEYFLNAGFAVFLFEADGQGVNIGKTALKLEIEKLIEEIIKIIGRKVKLNSNKVGIAGISFGGYLALRAAYYHANYFKICINISGSPKVNKFNGLPRRLKEDFKFVFQETDEGMLKIFEQMYFEPTGRKFPPTLTIHGERDDIFPVESILNLDKQLGSQHKLFLFKDEAHVCLNKINNYIYDIIYWTKENF